MTEFELRLLPPDRAVGRVAGEPVEFDADQQSVIEARQGSGPLLVVGGPGTGKTSTLIEAVAARVSRDGLSPGSVLVLAPTRVAAANLRDRLTARLVGGATSAALLEPPARSPASYAFSLIRRQAVLAGEPSPRLISGPEQDVILADLLAGHAEGEGARPDWPAAVVEALPLTGFRHELRDLFMRAMERGISPEELSRLARRHRMPIWRAAAVVMREYLEVTTLSAQGAYDPAAIVDQAASLLAHDADLLAAERRRLRLIAVDDHQESSEAVARLLDQLCPPGADLLIAGDPDTTTQGFRGAQAGLLADAPARYPQRDGSPAPVLTLGTNHRYGAQIAAAATRVVSRIGALGPSTVERRSTESTGASGQLSTVLTRSAAAQAAYIAAELRRAHLRGGVPWSQLAVIARNSQQVATLRRGLLNAGVPVGFSAGEVALRDEPAVRPLLAVTTALLNPDTLHDPDVVVALLTSLTRLDAVALRALRRGLIRGEQAAGGARSSDELLRLALTDPEIVDELPLADRVPEEVVGQLRHVAGVLQAGRQVLTNRSATAESLLWAVWQATGFAELWRERALAGGPGGRRADRDLDAVVALFEAAARFADRLPGAGAMEFLVRLGETDLPEDSLAPSAPREEVVTVTTPQSVVGKEFDFVVIAGLQDGVWPNTRLRGSILGSTTLVDILAGRQVSGDVQALRAARREVLFDELRMLYVALTRARRRVLVTAVSNADTVPSAFLDLIDPPDDEENRARPVVSAPQPVSFTGVVAELRSIMLGSADAEQHAEAALLLNRLAAQRVAGAEPAQWYGWEGLSDDAALATGRPVPVSPSVLETFQQCGLRWLLDRRAGGSPPSPAKTKIGTLIHDLAYEMPDASVPQLQAALAERWPELGIPEGWVSNQLYGRAETMLSKLHAYRRDSGEVVAAERDFRVQIGDAVLTGRVDQLELDADGNLVTVDFKTGRSAPSKAKVAENAQLAAYQLAVEAGAFADVAPGAGNGGAQLVQLGTPAQKVGVQHQPALGGAAWATDLVHQAASGMAGAVFTATPTEACRHCPVRASCPAQPEGKQVGR